MNHSNFGQNILTVRTKTIPLKFLLLWAAPAGLGKGYLFQGFGKIARIDRLSSPKLLKLTCIKFRAKNSVEVFWRPEKAECTMWSAV